MPIDEEQPEFALDISAEAKRTLQSKLVSSGVAGVLSLVPGVGGAIMGNDNGTRDRKNLQSRQ